MLANRVDQVVKPRYSLRASLLWLLAACILPAASVSVSLAIAHYRLLRDQIHHGTVMLARQVAERVVLVGPRVAARVGQADAVAVGIAIAIATEAARANQHY